MEGKTNIAYTTEEENDEALKLIRPGEIRVRIAPSPTGPAHIGLARVALFNYLFAKKNNGTVVLRIEDTDEERSEKKWENQILESLKWLNIEWQEGPDKGGNFGPYRQSERKNIYRKYIKKLLTEKKLYPCFCSPEDLEAHRQYLMSIGQPPRYSGKCRNLSEEEVERNLRQGKKFVLRFKMPAEKVVFEDMLRGKIEYDTSLIGDIVVAKNEETPLYNLACVIDDFEMGITHVIRGEDHIPNTPKQILLARALGIKPPKYLHLPLVLGPDRTKLSKRHGAQSILEYKEQGYLPEAMVNFLSFLGWSPESDREIFSLPQLIQEFSTERIQKSGAIFNIKKLDWLNGFYIRKKPIDQLTELCLPYFLKDKLIAEINGEEKALEAPEIKTRKFKIIETGEIVSIDYLKKILTLYQERLKKLSEISGLTDFFFRKQLDYPKEMLKWKDLEDAELKIILDKLKKSISHIKEEDWTEEKIREEILEKLSLDKKIKKISKDGKDRGYFLWPLRVALSGKKASASPFDIAFVIGKEKTLKRLQEAIDKI